MGRGLRLGDQRLAPEQDLASLTGESAAEASQQAYLRFLLVILDKLGPRHTMPSISTCKPWVYCRHFAWSLPGRISPRRRGHGRSLQGSRHRLDRPVAIKVLPEHVAADPDLKQRFEREAKTVAALSHPHICPALPSKFGLP